MAVRILSVLSTLGRVSLAPGRKWYSCSSAAGTSTCQALVYSSFGQPEDVVRPSGEIIFDVPVSYFAVDIGPAGSTYFKYRLEEHPLKEVGSKDIAVEMVMCVVNPSDINQIQGVYPIKPSLPAVGGGEGVGVVTERGAAVTALKEGDWVIPAGTGMGTWRTKLVANASQFTRISQDIPLQMAATLAVNPTTAYRMLKDFVKLKAGDCVIQNGANSGVGQSVVQLTAAWGIKTINIIRDRPDLAELKSYLFDLGASEVVTEEFCSSHQMKELIEKYGRPVLGFNCVGGRSATNLMKQLAPEAVMVTYGGMSRGPVTVGTGSLIFKDLKIVGYWNSKWLETNVHSLEHVQMLSDLCEMAREGRLQPPPCVEHALQDYKNALSRAMKPFVGSKQLLVMK